MANNWISSNGKVVRERERETDNETDRLTNVQIDGHKRQRQTK